MWYRQVEGRKVGKAKSELESSINSTWTAYLINDTWIAAATVTPASDSSSSTDWGEDQCPVEDQYEINNSFGVRNHKQHLHRIQGSPSVPLHNGAETFFFDDSATFQDSPEDLDWFFEASQPGLFSTMGLQPAPTFQEAVAMPALLNCRQPIPSPRCICNCHLE